MKKLKKQEFMLIDEKGRKNKLKVCCGFDVTIKDSGHEEKQKFFPRVQKAIPSLLQEL